MHQTAPVRVLHLLASADRRGAEVFACALADALDARGHEDQVVALAPARRAGLDVEVLPALRTVGAARELRRRAAGCDVVLGHGSRGLVAGTLATVGSRTPLVYRSIGDPTYWGSSRLRRLRVSLQLRRAARVTALWPAAADAIARQYGVHRSRLVVVPNAADETLYVPAPEQARADARRELGLAPDAPVFASIGALAEEKRVDLAIAAVAAVPGAVLLIAGDGPQRELIAAAASQVLAGRHRLLGPVADVRPLYAAADAVVLLSNTEGQPGVAIEAGLCGVPVVATDVGGVGSVVVDGLTGRLVSARPTQAEASAALTDAAARRAELGGAARARCEARFSLSTVVARFEEVLAEARGGGRRR